MRAIAAPAEGVAVAVPAPPSQAVACVLAPSGSLPELQLSRDPFASPPGAAGLAAAAQTPVFLVGDGSPTSIGSFPTLTAASPTSAVTEPASSRQPESLTRSSRCLPATGSVLPNPAAAAAKMLSAAAARTSESQPLPPPCSQFAAGASEAADLQSATTPHSAAVCSQERCLAPWVPDSWPFAVQPRGSFQQGTATGSSTAALSPPPADAIRCGSPAASGASRLAAPACSSTCGALDLGGQAAQPALDSGDAQRRLRQALRAGRQGCYLRYLRHLCLSEASSRLLCGQEQEEARLRAQATAAGAASSLHQCHRFLAAWVAAVMAAYTRVH